MAQSHRIFTLNSTVGALGTVVFPQGVRDQGGFFHMSGSGTPVPFAVQFLGRLTTEAPWIVLAQVDQILSFGDESFNNEGLDGTTMLSKTFPMLPQMTARIQALAGGGFLDLWLVE